MPKLVIFLDDDVHRRAKTYSAKTDVSLSRVFRDYILSVTGEEAVTQDDVIARYARLDISAKDAMGALGLECLEDLMQATVSAGHPLPRVDRKVADSMARAALKLL